MSEKIPARVFTMIYLLHKYKLIILYFNYLLTKLQTDGADGC